MNELLQIAIDAALEAGEEILKIYASEDFEVKLKNDDSPLTKADVIAHEIISSHLQETKIPILSEEGSSIPYSYRKNWRQLWIVDPIDGTKEFIKRNGEFTVNIALVENQIPVLGVVYAPVLNELYFSTEHLGAYLNTSVERGQLDGLLASSEKLPIEDSREKFTVVASRSHLSKETEAFINELKIKHGEVELISKGSSLKMCMVAKGEADCYPRFAPTMEWDTAAGQAICNHSGRKVLDVKTRETMMYNRVELRNNWFIVE